MTADEPALQSLARLLETWGINYRPAARSPAPIVPDPRADLAGLSARTPWGGGTLYPAATRRPTKASEAQCQMRPEAVAQRSRSDV